VKKAGRAETSVELCLWGLWTAGVAPREAGRLVRKGVGRTEGAGGRWGRLGRLVTAPGAGRKGCHRAPAKVGLESLALYLVVLGRDERV